MISQIIITKNHTGDSNTKPLKLQKLFKLLNLK